MEKIIEYCMFLAPNVATESEIDEIVANVLFDEYQ